MKIVFLIINLIIACQVFAQTERDANKFNSLKLEEKREFLINELLNDTIKFSKKDIYHATIGTQNQNPYSELYIINRKQFFKFDIVEGSCVKEFTKKYLKKSKVKEVIKLTKNQSVVLYGASGKNGVTVIKVKSLKKITLDNCGFIETGKNSGANLDQWKKGEVRIRN